MSQLLSQKPQRETFKWDCTREQAIDILRTCYTVDVQARGRACVMDEATEGHIFRLACWLTDPTDNHFGVMFIGGLGNGKTTMMRALERAYWWMLKCDGYDYQREHQLTIRNAKNLTIQDKSWYMLGIDDLGTEPIEIQEYGNILTPSTDILYHRYDKRLPTFVTTNLAQDPKDGETLRQRYGDRLADRFNEMFFVIGFYNQSYR